MFSPNAKSGDPAGSVAAAHMKGASGTTLRPVGKDAKPGSSAVRAHAGQTFKLGLERQSKGHQNKQKKGRW